LSLHAKRKKQTGGEGCQQTFWMATNFPKKLVIVRKYLVFLFAVFVVEHTFIAPKHSSLI